MHDYNETLKSEYEVRTRDGERFPVATIAEAEALQQQYLGSETFRRVVKTQTTVHNWLPVNDHGPAILALPMRSNDANAATVRDYLIKLLTGVWREREGFNGKRPFGNSGWEYDLYQSLAAAELIDVPIDDYGEIVYPSGDARAKADRLIAAAIAALGEVVVGVPAKREIEQHLGKLNVPRKVRTEWTEFLVGLPWKYLRPVAKIAITSKVHPALVLGNAIIASSDAAFKAASTKHLMKRDIPSPEPVADDAA